MRLSEFPESWGLSIVTPIPKEGDKLLPGNWRPISQMRVIGLLLEKAIHKQMTYYMQSNRILHPNQHGFRSGKSTGSAIFQYLKYQYQNFDPNNITIATYIDYKKAFDTISHKILIKKLKLYGFSSKTILWFQNYLDSRSQSTSVSGQRSRVKDIGCGVPQGSTLGPTLFILYVNDLFYYKSIKETNILMYADDTVTFMPQ